MKRIAAKGKKRISLDFQTGANSTVFVAGSFNGWNPDAKPLKPVDDKGSYRATLMLPKGRHEYKFVVNGTWYTDPANPEIVANGMGSANSVIVVR